MSLPVIFREEAEADMAEAALWYERRSLGLGAEFVRSVDACLALISRQPTLFPIVHRQARMALPPHFSSHRATGNTQEFQDFPRVSIFILPPSAPPRLRVNPPPRALLFILSSLL